MMKLTGWVASAALLVSGLAVSAGASAQVAWTVANGKVTGVQGVSVLGSFYDVTFGGSPATTVFTSDAFALAAARALVEQVFISAAPLSLDSNPSVLAGCLWWDQCYADTLTGTTRGTFGETLYTLAYAWNAGIGQDTYALTALDPRAFTGIDKRHTVAAWSLSPVSAVPEPETYAMMLAGLWFIGARARRSKTKLAA